VLADSGGAPTDAGCGHRDRRALGLLSPRRRVFAYRIQKLRGNRHQALPVGGRARALPVGGGPRDPEWFREDFRALLELLA
jgi:NADPH2:quinone reductase